MIEVMGIFLYVCIPCKYSPVSQETNGLVVINLERLLIKGSVFNTVG